MWLFGGAVRAAAAGRESNKVVPNYHILLDDLLLFGGREERHRWS